VSTELTFAEAMALDPSDVEVQHDVDKHRWLPLSEHLTDMTLRYLRQRTFRRAKPKRSRVQEMGEALLKEGKLGVYGSLVDESMVAAIRAVCEWMRRRGAIGLLDVVASDIEREFLEPR
jgi:hypothetical protein